MFPSIAELDRSWGGPGSLTLIDIPIGLPDDASFRACDAAARRLLGRRASSVFNPPTRSALAGGSYTEACDLNEMACGKRLSKQAWGTMPKIAEVDRYLRAGLHRPDRIRESHPETLFHILGGGRNPRHRKKEAEGRRERLAVLDSHLPRAEQIARELGARIPRRQAGPDDILDALVSALVATRFGASLGTLPEVPGRDSVGLVCEMVVPRV